MPLFGPRLDRPSAVGEEGRPRAASLTVAAVVVAAVAAAAGFAVGRPGMVPSLASLVGLAVAGAALLGRDRLAPLIVGQLLFVPACAALVGLVGAAFAGSPYGVLTAGLVVAAVGLAGSWTDALDEEHLERVLSMTGIWYASMLVAAVVLALVGGVVAGLLFVVRDFLGGVGPTASVIGFAVLVGGAALSVRLALWALPVVQLARASRRPVLERRVARVRRGTTVAVIASIVVVAGVFVAWNAGLLAELYADSPVVPALFRLLSTPFVAGPVVLVGVACVPASMLAWLARRTTRRVDAASTRVTASFVSGTAAVLLVVATVFGLVPVAGGAAAVTVVAAAITGPILVFLVVLAGMVAIWLDLLPDRAGGPALAGSGLCLAALGAGLAGLPGPVTFALVAAALVVWDVSSFGLGVTAELGHRPETRRLELFHGVVGVGLAGGAVLVASGVEFARSNLGAASDAAPVAVLAVLGVVSLLALVRG